MMCFSRWLSLIAVAGLVVACGSMPPQGVPASSVPESSAPESSAAATAQVTGRVLAGPVMPVSRAGHPNSRPVPGARVQALDGDRVVAVTRTDRSGHYTLALPAGSYVIAVADAGFRPPGTRTVVAVAGHQVTVNFTLDTGIR